MEPYKYVDLFATKGIEYVFIIGFLFLLILFWKFLNSRTRLAVQSISENTSPTRREWFLIPDGLYYHQGHTWAKPDAADTMKVGIDDFAQMLIGLPDQIELPKIGSKIRQGDKGWEMTIDSKPISMIAPVTGEVVNINHEVIEHPELLNQDPYEKGWLMEIKPQNTKADLNNLLRGNFVTAWIDQTLNSLRERMGGELGIVYQDGGVPISGIAKILSPMNWDEIVKEYFLTE